VISGVELPNPEELYELKGKGFTKRVAPIPAILAVILAIMVMSFISIRASSHRVFYFAVISAVQGPRFTQKGFFLVVQIPLFY
jgi:hypothetical protein